MSIPGVASEAAEQIQDDVITDEKAEINVDDEAGELEGARQEKDDVEDVQDAQSNHDSIDEVDKLERGAFQPHAYPHIGFDDYNYSPDGKQSGQKGSIHKDANKRENVRPQGRGCIGRRFSDSGPTMTSEAAELARAEAASWAQMTPLMAATLGPLSVMLGIPTLTQRWRGQLLDPPVLPTGGSNFVELPDPALNLALGGVTLFCEVAGNGLLILRFANFHTKITTWVSYAFWWMKIILGLANYIEFGINYPQTENIIYLQGFWVGVCSMGVTMIILVFLTFNLAFLHQQSEEETRRLHNVQWEFMMQTLIFFLFTGVCALIFCKVEDSSYVDGIYYMVVTTLTIGFGDLTPNTAVLKVLTFPFTIIGITLLALIVTSIIRLLSDRARRRKIELKKRLKQKTKERKRMHAGYGSRMRSWSKKHEGDGPKLKRSLTLQEELQKLREDDWKRERRANLKSMITGFTVFVIFWFMGALIFHFVEPWGYGNSLYFCYIFFLTIGFGDYSPGTEAGRPVFIVYALLAVPTMTIIVETVTTNFTSFTMHGVNKRRNKVYKDKDFEIKSIESLVRIAKKNTKERIERSHSTAVPSTAVPSSAVPSVHLPLQELNDRLTDSLQQMHHHLQSLLMQKLGPDARNVIAAERARQTRTERERLAATATRGEGKLANPDAVEHMANTLGELGQDAGDELELLNDYRVRYANILAELLVAKDRLLGLETGLERRTSDPALRRRLSKDIEILSSDEDEIDKRRRRAIRITSSDAESNGGVTLHHDNEDGISRGRRDKRRKSSTGGASGGATSHGQGPRGEESEQ